LQKPFHLNKIHQLKIENPATWWRNIKSLDRLDRVKSSNDHLKYKSAEIPTDQLPDIINKYFGSVTQHIPRLDHAQFSNLRSSLEPLPDEIVVFEYEVFKELSNTKFRESIGPDAVPHKILKDFANMLAASVAAIINASIRHSVVPEFWKV
jgi:hypothetical protein